MSEKNIREVTSGQKSIPATEFNSLISSVNRFNKMTQDSTFNNFVVNDGKNITNSGYVPIENHPFKIHKYKKDKISVTGGRWVRNQIETTLIANGNVTEGDAENQFVLDITHFTNAGVEEALVADTDYYVYVELQGNVASTVTETDEALLPAELVLKVDRDRKTANVIEADEIEGLITAGLESRDFFVKTKGLIGVVQLTQSGTNWYIKSIKQSISDDIIDREIVPDLFSKDNASSATYRQTLAYNAVYDLTPGEYNHFGEMQISAVQTCHGLNSATFPFFLSTSTDNSRGGPNGYLQWASTDNEYFPQVGSSNPTHKTIEIEVDGDATHIDGYGDNYHFIQLKNATNSDKSLGPQINSKSMAYINTTTNATGTNQVQGELRWAGLDTHLSNYGYQRSIEIASNVAGEAIVQLHNMDVGGNLTLTESDRIAVRDANGGNGGSSLEWTGAGNLGEWLRTYDSDWNDEIDVNISNWWDANANHYDLVDIAGGSYTDHDHGNYWQNVDSSNGRYGFASYDYLVNNGSSIGDSSKSLTINLDGRTLTNGVWYIDDTTGAGDRAGSLVVSGGGYFAKAIYAKRDTTLDAAGYFDNGDIYAQLSSSGGHFFVGDLFVDAGGGQDGAIVSYSTVAAGDQAGAILAYYGGMYAAKGIYAEKGTGSYAGYLTDGTRNFTIADGTNGAYSTDSTYVGALVSSGAGVYADYNAGTIVAKLATSTYAIDASGARINSVLGFSFNGTDGVTGDGFSGGIKTSATASNAAEETRVNDILVGHGLI